ncbi:MAG: DNA mismatch repair endonuclease MutL [Eubacteriales bacterium]|nr:DNA mismatch repair endonuclease MutL [Eubacteriales bacterium]
MTQETLPSIHLLAEDVAQKIAAGEVVERPASVVKELVENSIDAGSTFITVEIRDGGISYIRISDNGCGIAGEEVKLAFARHATSKLRTAQDLFNIRQMGFRGEALYSVAAVSNLEMVTKPAQQEMGKRIAIRGGHIGALEDCGCPDGTSITVADLFFNTPARLKFLSAPATEAAGVAGIVSRLILANPGISIKLIHNQRVVYHSPGDGDLQNAIYAVFGKDFAANLLPVREQWGDYRVEGMVGTPEISRSSRSQQVFLVNRRPITHLALCRLVEDLYGGALAAKRYPVFVLNITVPPDQVDVNVHPNKLQVRFGDEKRIRALLQTAVSKALGLQSRTAIALEVPQEKLPDRGEERLKVFQPRPLAVQDYTPREATGKEKPETDLGSAKSTPNIPASTRPTATPQNQSRASTPAEAPPETMEESIRRVRSALSGAMLAADPTSTVLDVRKALQTPPVMQESIPVPAAPLCKDEARMDVDVPAARVVGQVFLAYVVLETEKGLYLVDQHAAHERLLYDKFRARLEASAVCSQPLLVPENVDLSYEEMQSLEENRDIFEQLGFEFEQYGSLCCHIRAVPFVLGQPQVGPLFRDILYMLAHDKTVTGAEAKKERLMSMACRRAVKAGDKLSDPELKELLHIIVQENIPLTCPHGRPFVLYLSKADIDRHFKRIK